MKMINHDKHISFKKNSSENGVRSVFKTLMDHLLLIIVNAHKKTKNKKQNNNNNNNNVGIAWWDTSENYV